MISNNKLIWHQESIENKTPVTADIFLTEFCNAKCDWCIYAKHSKHNKNYMCFEDFVYTVNKLINAGIKSVVLTGGGEPTINPDFERIIKYLEANNIQYGVNTNGISYKEMKKASFVKVSVDGWNKESYIAKKRIDRFDDVVMTLKRYVQDGINVGVQQVSENPEEVINFYNAMKDINVAYITFRPLEGSNVDRKNAEEIIAAIEKINDERVYKHFKWDKLDNSFKKCYGHCLTMTLRADGKLAYCCNKPEEIVAHITDDDFAEKHKRAKTDMKKCDKPCRLTGVNEFMENYINKPIDVNFI